MYGRYFPEYEQTTRIDKPVSEVFADFDAATAESFPGHESEWLYSSVLLPPLCHEGTFVRGILLTMGAELLLERHPGLSSLFHVIASGQWCNFPWSRRADALCAIYDNPVRAAWFRARYPERARQRLLPIQEADWTNERLFAPSDATPRTRDILCVSRQIRLKNLPFLAEAVRICSRKYQPVRMSLVAGHETDFRNLSGEPLAIMRDIERRLGRVEDYLDLLPFTKESEMPARYSSHKVFVLGSLVEGKNRALHEAMCCDTPVVCARAFNQYVRGNAPVFPDGAGCYAEFDPESFADAIQHVLDHPNLFRPRASYLAGFSGRMHVLDQCVRAFEYPAVVRGSTSGSLAHSAWLQQALLQAYGCDLETFVYELNPCNDAIGLEHHDRLVAFYQNKVTNDVVANAV